MDVKLVMFKPNGQRKDLPVSKKLTILGRGENCEVRIPLENVSRRHCEISLAGDELKAKDLASSNGTYVNNRRINECSLSAGDRLVVGPVVFTVQIDGKPGDIEPIKTRGEKSEEAKLAGEEVVELEADVIDDNSSADDVLAAAMGDSSSEEELDPIAALEALAADGQKKKKE